MFNLYVYRSKPNAFQAPGGYWHLRIVNSADGTRRSAETPISEGTAAQLIAMGATRLPDGGTNA